jgi:hypothetical protein
MITVDASLICTAHPKSFTHKFALSPKKTSTQDLKQKHVVILKHNMEILKDWKMVKIT